MGLYIGLMSGTSADSVDAALLDVPERGPPRLLSTHSAEMPPALRGRILALFANQPTPPRALGELDTRLGRLFAKAAREAMRLAGVRPAKVIAIGSHGQTAHHSPDGRFPFTLQLGDPNIIAEVTGVTTVADFRRRDIAAGGQGAPLAPAFHAYALRSENESRVILNLGGIANITILPAGAHRSRPVVGFDTGPGNGLLDAWTYRELGQTMDAQGDWSRSGSVHRPLLGQLLAHDYFEREPPKSTGRELFGIDWLLRHLARLDQKEDARDVASTVCELTAESVARAVKRWAFDVDTVLVCGGGVNNRYLMQRLAATLRPVRVDTTAAAGIPPAWVECMAFGWLAHRTLCGLGGNLPSVTGARREVVLGSIHAGRSGGATRA